MSISEKMTLRSHQPEQKSTVPVLVTPVLELQWLKTYKYSLFAGFCSQKQHIPSKQVLISILAI